MLFPEQADRGREDELCRICFSSNSTVLNVFETAVTTEMTIADMFVQCLGENMYPDDDLPGIICCDCIEEVMLTESIDETFKAALKYLVWRTKLLKSLEYMKENGRCADGSFNLTLQIYKLEDKSACVNRTKVKSVIKSLLSFPGVNVITQKSDNDVESRKEPGNSINHNLSKENNLDSLEHNCSFCWAVFFSAEELNRHKNLFHDNPVCFPCGKCYKKFKTMKRLERHINKHNFHCKYQGYLLAEESVRNSSILLHTKSSSAPSIPKSGVSSEEKSKDSEKKRVTYTCGKCDCSYERKEELKAHLREAHSSATLCICGICNAGFLSKLDLELHKYVHPKEFLCEVCKQRLSTLNSYKRHIKFCQEKISNHKCQFCGKVTTTRKNLKLHLATHLRVGKFECHICQRKFNRTEHMYDHVRAVHLKQKPHECGACHKFFSHRCNLLHHMRSHSDEKTFSCSFCGIKYKSRKGKYKHEKNIHGYSKERVKYIVEDEIIEKALLGRL